MVSSSRPPKLISFDAFAKTVEDARIKTTSGGIITLVCILVTLLLIRNEYIDYTTIITRPELVVDRDINKQLDINLDISFYNLPCDMISIDLLDETGDLQLDIINSGLAKYRLIKSGNSMKEEIDDSPALKPDISLKDMAKGLPEGSTEECGSCFGALPQDKNQYCCNDCETVRRAYAEMKWQFYDGENVKQCEQEGYVTRIKQRIESNEGCRIKGTAKINRVSGQMDFAPGASFTSEGRHVHDLSLYMKYKDKFNFNHKINHLSFGNNKQQNNELDQYFDSIQPLDNYKFDKNSKFHQSTYYLKIVSTRFESLDSTKKVETNQFSVITHDRPLQGGKDDDHQHTLHARGGVPGVIFNFDISPLKIINRQQYAKTWSGFVLGVISSIAGVLMVGTLLDRSVFAAQQAINGKKDL